MQQVVHQLAKMDEEDPRVPDPKATATAPIHVLKRIDNRMVPLLVTAADLDAAVQDSDGLVDFDILGSYLQGHGCNELLWEARERGRLVVILDGLDKAGASSAPLETYIRTKLSREVRLCVTGQESGVSQQALAWIEGECLHLRVQPLTRVQQQALIELRLGEMNVARTSLEERVRGFNLQLERGFSHELLQSPLLLNLMISEFMLHEDTGDAIHFHGRIVPDHGPGCWGTVANPRTTTEYVASFPGAEKRTWDRVARTLKHQSVACKWMPPASELHRLHYNDPRSDGRCFCQTFLYHDLPERVKTNAPFSMIMHDSDVHTKNVLPAVGKKVEVKDGPEWFVCTVLQLERRNNRLKIKPDGRLGLPAEWLQLNDLLPDCAPGMQKALWVEYEVCVCTHACW